MADLTSQIFEKIAQSDAAARECRAEWTGTITVPPKASVNIDQNLERIRQESVARGLRPAEIESNLKMMRGILEKNRQGFTLNLTATYLHRSGVVKSSFVYREFPTASPDFDYYNGTDAVNVQHQGEQLFGELTRGDANRLARTAPGFAETVLFCRSPLLAWFPKDQTTVSRDPGGILLTRKYRVPGEDNELLVRAILDETSGTLRSLELVNPYNNARHVAYTLSYGAIGQGLIPDRVECIMTSEEGAVIRTQRYSLTAVSFALGAASELDKPFAPGTIINDRRFGSKHPMKYKLSGNQLPSDKQALGYLHASNASAEALGAPPDF